MADETTQETGHSTPDLLKDPAVLAAIENAATKAAADVERRWQRKYDEDTKGLRSNKDTILEEKRKLQEERDALAVKAAAAAAGVDPDKVTELANKEAARLAELKRREYADELKAAQERADKLEGRAKELEARNRRLSISGLVPWDGLLDSPDVRDIVLRRIDPLVSFQEKDGADVPILMRDGEVIPHTLGDLLGQAREGRGPLSNLQPFFKSNGKGSGTTSVNGAMSGTKNIHKMTDTERAAHVREVGLEKFKEELANTPAPKVELSTQRRS